MAKSETRVEECSLQNGDIKMPHTTVTYTRLQTCAISQQFGLHNGNNNDNNSNNKLKLREMHNCVRLLI